MPSTAQSQLTTPGPCRYDVELVGSDPAALVRVLGILHRRRCTIAEVDYDAAASRLAIVVAPPAGHAASVPAWLANLVDVARVTAA